LPRALVSATGVTVGMPAAEPPPVWGSVWRPRELLLDHRSDRRSVLGPAW